MENESKTNEWVQVKGVIDLCLKHWYYFVISLIVFGFLGLIYLKLKTPKLGISSTVAIRYDESLSGGTVSKSQSLMSAFGLGGKSGVNIEDESFKMASQGYVKQVVKELNLNERHLQRQFLGLLKEDLFGRSPLTLSYDNSLPDTLSKRIKFNIVVDAQRQAIVKLKYGKRKTETYTMSAFPGVIETPYGKFAIAPSPYFDAYPLPVKINVVLTGYDYTTQIYRTLLLASFQKKTSDLVDLSIVDAIPERGKMILQKTIDIYNAEWREDKDLVTAQTLQYIEERLQMSEITLNEADDQIKTFKNRHNLTNVETDARLYLEQDAELQAKMLDAETQLNIIDIIVSFVSDKRNEYALIPLSLPVAENAALAEAVGKYNTQLMRLNDIKKTEAIKESSMVTSLDEQVKTQRQNLLMSLDNVKQGMQIAVKNLRAKDREIGTRIGSLPSIERGYAQLKRNQEVQQTVYIFLLEMREETAVKSVSLLPKLKVINDPFVLNEPVEPNLMKVAVVILFFGGIICPLLAIYLLPRKKKSVR